MYYNIKKISGSDSESIKDIVEVISFEASKEKDANGSLVNARSFTFKFSLNSTSTFKPLDELTEQDLINWIENHPHFYKIEKELRRSSNALKTLSLNN